LLTISQKRFFGSLHELALFVEPDIKESMIAWAFAGWELPGIKNQIFPEKTEVGISNFD